VGAVRPFLSSTSRQGRDGEARPFDHRQYDAFQRLIQQWGAPENVALKARVSKAVLEGKSPVEFEIRDRVGRTNFRVILRQMQAVRCSSPTFST
jgi:hypothetical protein